MILFINEADHAKQRANDVIDRVTIYLEDVLRGFLRMAVQNNPKVE